MIIKHTSIIYFRNVNAVCEFTLLWQNGGIIQLGGIDCLLMCKNNHQSKCFITTLVIELLLFSLLYQL